MLAFWWHACYQATDGGMLSEISALAKQYLIAVACVVAAIMAYAVAFRIFGKVPFLQLGVVILLLVALAAYLLIGDHRCVFAPTWTMSGQTCQQ